MRQRESCGPKPARPELVATGTLTEAVPVTGLAANFSPIPRTAPLPLGGSSVGAATANVASPPGVGDGLTPDPTPDRAFGSADDLAIDPIVSYIQIVSCIQSD